MLFTINPEKIKFTLMLGKNIKKPLSEAQIRQKIEYFCAYQERALSEVSRKLTKMGVEDEQIPRWIAELKENQFLSQERYLSQYVNGHVQYKRWGARKVIFALKAKGFEEAEVKPYLDGIPEEERYAQFLKAAEQAEKKQKEQDPFKRKQKIAAHLFRKGFDIGWINRYLQSEFENI